METNDDKHLRLFSDKNIPLLFFDRFYPTIASDRIVIDDLESGYNATNLLIKRGCKRIAHIAGPELLNIYRDRKDGFLKAVSDAGLPFYKDYLIFTRLTRAEGYPAVEKLMTLPEPPDGIFCGNDTTALGALVYCKKNRIKIPDQVALTGFSDEPFGEVVTPSLSTIRQPGYRMGFTAAQRIIERIENINLNMPFEEIVLPTQVIERETTR